MFKHQIVNILGEKGDKVHRKWGRLLSFTHPVHFCEYSVLPATLDVG
jgi:hypothetical protein